LIVFCVLGLNISVFESLNYVILDFKFKLGSISKLSLNGFNAPYLYVGSELNLDDL